MRTTIEQLMTGAPLTVGADVSIAAAGSIMSGFGVRHLPVRDEGRLVGVVSISDLGRAEPYRMVREVMRRDPLVVDREDAAADVASTMAERHTDVAVVAHGDRVVGIFTATDAERVLGATLQAFDDERR